jgi:hypothetical protein
MNTDIENLINTLLEKQIQQLKEGIEWLENLKPGKTKKKSAPKKKAPWNKGRKWSKEQHDKFRKTMKAVWDAKRNNK